MAEGRVAAEMVAADWVGAGKAERLAAVAAAAEVPLGSGADDLGADGSVEEARVEEDEVVVGKGAEGGAVVEMVVEVKEVREMAAEIVGSEVAVASPEATVGVRAELGKLELEALVAECAAAVGKEAVAVGGGGMGGGAQAAMMVAGSPCPSLSLSR